MEVLVVNSLQEEGKIFNWSDDLSVGSANIDVQHMTFISFINDAHRSLNTPGARGEIRQVLENLMNYIEVHFAYEEDLFARHNYPQSAEHKKEHADFIADVKKYYVEYASGAPGVNTAVCLFMKDWLTRHIAGSDKKYAEYFRSKNIEI